MSDARSAAQAISIMTALASLGSKIVAYRGSAGQESVTGYIDDNPEFFGVETATLDGRFVAYLLASQVGAPQRGDLVIDESGKEWTLRDEILRDAGFCEWTLQAR